MRASFSLSQSLWGHGLHHQLLLPLKKKKNKNVDQLFSIFVFSFGHYQFDHLSFRVLFQRWNGTCAVGTFHLYFKNPTCVSTYGHFSATELEKCRGCLQNRQWYSFWLWKSLWKMLWWRRSTVSLIFPPFSPFFQNKIFQSNEKSAAKNLLRSLC